MRQRQQRPVRMTFASLLRAVLDAAPFALCANGVGLYVVQLGDERAFEVALRIHAQFGGPEPKEIRKRATLTEARKPMMAGAAPLAVLVRALETLAASDEDGMRAWLVRELASSGAVPVVILEHGAAEITTLGALEEGVTAAVVGARRSDVEDLGGWFRPTEAEA